MHQCIKYIVECYICSSVHRNSRLKKSNKMQQYADIYLPLNYSTCFGRPVLLMMAANKYLHTVVSCWISSTLLWNDTLYVSDGLCVHHQEFNTVHTGIGVRQTDTADCLLAGTRWSSTSYPLASRQQYLFDICLLLYVQY